jgi:hypothetical protein
MPSGEKTGKMTIDRVAAFKSEMHSDTLVNLHKKYNEVSMVALCHIRSGQTWANVEPKRSKF